MGCVEERKLGWRLELVEGERRKGGGGLPDTG